MATGYPDFSFPQGGQSVTTATVAISGSVGTVMAENVDATSAPIIRTMPAATPRRGYRFKLQKIDSSENTVTIHAQAGDYFLTSKGLVTEIILYAQGDYVWLLSSGAAVWLEG